MASKLTQLLLYFDTSNYSSCSVITTTRRALLDGLEANRIISPSAVYKWVNTELVQYKLHHFKGWSLHAQCPRLFTNRCRPSVKFYNKRNGHTCTHMVVPKDAAVPKSLARHKKPSIQTACIYTFCCSDFLTPSSSARLQPQVFRPRSSASRICHQMPSLVVEPLWTFANSVSFKSWSGHHGRKILCLGTSPTLKGTLFSIIEARSHMQLSDKLMP